MPAQRRAPVPSAPFKPVARPSKLAKEQGITAAQESEIREAFNLFVSADGDAKELTIPTAAVRRALTALNLTPSRDELRELVDAADPEGEGFVGYENFVAVAAMKLHHQDEVEREDDDDDDDEGEDEYEEEVIDRKGKGRGGKRAGGGGGRGQRGEVEHAFKLFTGGTGDVITLGALRKVAADLKEEVSDDVLREMMREAGAGSRGVAMDEFEGVMRRAGVFR